MLLWTRIFLCCFFLSARAGYVALTPQELHIAKEQERKTIKLAEEMIQLANLSLSDCPRPLVSLTPYKLTYPYDSAQTQSTLRDFLRIEALGWSYTFYEKECYQRRLLYYVHAWSAKYNLIPQPIYPSDIASFTNLVKGYSLARMQTGCVQRRQIDSWLQSVLDGLMLTQEEDSSLKDQAIRVELAGFIGYLLDNEEAVNYAKENFERLIDQLQLETDFLCKANVVNALHILRPLLGMAIVAERNGDSIYSYEGVQGYSLKKQTQHLLPIFSGKAPHLYPGKSLALSILQQIVYFELELQCFLLYGHPWSSFDAYINTLHYLADRSP